MERILIINAGQSQKNYVFKRVAECDYHVTVLNPYILKDIENYVDDWIFSDLNDITSCIEKITQAHNKEKFDGILTFWEEDVLLTAEVSEKLGLPGVNFELAQNIRNKFLFRKLCKEKAIVTPEFLSLENDSSLEIIEKNMTFPCVIKPVYGACSAFVRKCDSAQEAFQYYQETIESPLFQEEVRLGNVKGLFLESYIGGQEVDIDMLVQGGKVYYAGVSDNFDIEGGFFIEAGQECPSRLEKDIHNTIREQALEMIQKLGIQDACLHFEAKVENGKVIPIELNMRMGGDEVWYFNKEVYGVDLIENAIKIACGKKVSNYIGIPTLCHVHGEYFLPTQAGTIRKINIDTKKLSELGVIKYEMRKKEGDMVNIPPYDFGFLGWYIVKFDMRKSFERFNDREIRKCFHIEIEA